MYRSLAGVVLLGCALFVADGGARAEQKSSVDLTGTWLFDVKTEAGSGRPTVTFVQKGDRLTGRYSSTNFGNVDIAGVVKGNSIRFFFKVKGGTGTVDVEYNGAMEQADVIKGTVTMSHLGDGVFSARRKAPGTATPKPSVLEATPESLRRAQR